MFRDVPGCSGMFHVPGFIDGPVRTTLETVLTLQSVRLIKMLDRLNVLRNCLNDQIRGRLLPVCHPFLKAV